MINYKNTGGGWKGFAKKDNFAVRWSGWLKITKAGTYRISLTSDDGSRMFLRNMQPREAWKRVINNDGLHSLRRAEMTVTLHARKPWGLIVEYFEAQGHAGCMLKYMGPDTNDKMEFINSPEGPKAAMRVTDSAAITPKMKKMQKRLEKARRSPCLRKKKKVKKKSKK